MCVTTVWSVVINCMCVTTELQDGCAEPYRRTKLPSTMLGNTDHTHKAYNFSWQDQGAVKSIKYLKTAKIKSAVQLWLLLTHFCVHPYTCQLHQTLKGPICFTASYCIITHFSQYHMTMKTGGLLCTIYFIWILTGESDPQSFIHIKSDIPGNEI